MNRIVGVVLVVVAAGLLFFGWRVYQGKQEFLKQAHLASGVVIELKYKPPFSSGTGSYAPVVTYKTTEGRDVTFVNGVSANPPSYDKGDKVEVVYDPDKPEQAEINSALGLWLVPGILGGLGGTCLLFGLVLLRPRRLR